MKQTIKNILDMILSNLLNYGIDDINRLNQLLLSQYIRYNIIIVCFFSAKVDLFALTSIGKVNP